MYMKPLKNFIFINHCIVKDLLIRKRLYLISQYLFILVQESFLILDLMKDRSKKKNERKKKLKLKTEKNRRTRENERSQHDFQTETDARFIRVVFADLREPFFLFALLFNAPALIFPWRGVAVGALGQVIRSGFKSKGRKFSDDRKNSNFTLRRNYFISGLYDSIYPIAFNVRYCG